jgi:hypothetical protein
VIKSGLFVACAGVLCLAAASDAAAEPIRVTSGSLVFPSGNQFQTGPISITGTRGFSLTGGIDTGESNLGPFRQCSPCEASSTLELGGPTVSNAGFFDATLTFEGQTFLNVGFSDTATLLLGLSGTVAVPEVGPSPIVLTAPFALVFSSFQPDRGVDSVPIHGGGIAMVSLAPRFGFWELQGVRYDFVATPTPEPATLILIGGGAAAMGLRTRKRRSES